MSWKMIESGRISNSNRRISNWNFRLTYSLKLKFISPRHFKTLYQKEIFQSHVIFHRVTLPKK